MEIHQSQRGFFAHTLWQQMHEHRDIYLVSADMGYRMFDRIKSDFPDRFLNVGAAEQAGMGIAVGLALEGKIPFIYSITPFVLYRPFEFIRNYVNHESIPVRIVGSGRDRDYAADGISHQSADAEEALRLFPNIKSYWPETKEEVVDIVQEMVSAKNPCFVSLKR